MPAHWSSLANSLATRPLQALLHQVGPITTTLSAEACWPQMPALTDTTPASDRSLLSLQSLLLLLLLLHYPGSRCHTSLLPPPNPDSKEEASCTKGNITPTAVMPVSTCQTSPAISRVRATLHAPCRLKDLQDSTT
jgi:hypothetical protein